MVASANPHGLDSIEIIHRDDAEGQKAFDRENVVQHANGFQLRVPAVPVLDYLRVCDPDGNEIAYWSIEELREDPALVLGAAIGALVREG